MHDFYNFLCVYMCMVCVGGEGSLKMHIIEIIPKYKVLFCILRIVYKWY